MVHFTSEDALHYGSRNVNLPQTRNQEQDEHRFCHLKMEHHQNVIFGSVLYEVLTWYIRNVVVNHLFLPFSYYFLEFSNTQSTMIGEKW